MREQILNEIRRLAELRGGRPPGRMHFSTETGITEGKWSGVFWSKWSDALAEAGYSGNSFQERLDTGQVLSRVIDACRHYGHIPSTAELKLFARGRPEFPSKNTIANHFPTKRELLTALRDRAKRDSLADIAQMLPPLKAQEFRAQKIPAAKNLEGFVYLLRSGEHYKVGRSEQLERRVKELRISLPEALTLVHAIKTDDPSGIEAYWHRRFANRRANGEWFKLQPEDLSAFKRRTFQ